MRSQPTYEELKPDDIRRDRRSRKGSQPTYEELKQPVPYPLQLVFPRSQPTYEELKPYIVKGFTDPSKVLSLPMRN